MTRRTAMVLLATACLVPAGAGASSAADGIGLSLDGRSWHHALASPLFEPDFRWVPGDVETRSFYVRNQGPSGALMTVGVRTGDANRLLHREDLDIAARVGGSTWLPLENGEVAQALAEALVRRGAHARVDVRVRFDHRSPNRSETRVLPLTLRVRLTEHAIGTAQHGGREGSGTLPGTGSAAGVVVVWTGAALIGAGLALVTRRRRTGPVREVLTDG